MVSGTTFAVLIAVTSVTLPAPKRSSGFQRSTLKFRITSSLTRGQ